MGILVFALFAAGVGYYVYRSYAGMGKKGRSRQLGLPDGEYVEHEWPAELNVAISTAARVGSAAAALVAGALVGGVGIGTVRAPGVSFVITTRRRLLLRVEETEGKMTDYMMKPEDVTFHVLGPGPRKVNGLPSIVLRVNSQIRSIDVLTNEAYLPLLAALRAPVGHRA